VTGEVRRFRQSKTKKLASSLEQELSDCRIFG
jgi:hypothetical protein